MEMMTVRLQDQTPALYTRGCFLLLAFVQDEAFSTAAAHLPSIQVLSQLRVIIPRLRGGLGVLNWKPQVKTQLAMLLCK